MELRKESSIAWTPIHLKLFCTFEQFKAILEVHISILHCKTTCCYQMTSPSTSITLEALTTYALYHPVGIDSGWRKRQERVTCGVLYGRKPDVRRSAQRSRVRPDESQNCSVQKLWKIHQNTVYWCKWKVAQKKELQFYQTRSNAIILYNTLPAICIETVVYMKSREALCNKSVSVSKITAKSRT